MTALAGPGILEEVRACGRYLCLLTALVGCERVDSHDRGREAKHRTVPTPGPLPREYAAEEITRTSGRLEYTLRSTMDGENGERLEEARNHRVVIEPSTLVGKVPCSGSRFVTRKAVWMDGEHSYDLEDHWCVGPEGVTEYAQKTPMHDEVVEYAEAEVSLPSRAVVGARWTTPKGGAAGRYTCQAVATPFCADGIAVECASHDADLVWARNHYCRGLGWVGMDATSFVGDRRDLLAWTDVVVADGRAGPSVAREQRPLPATNRAARIGVGIRDAVVPSSSSHDAGGASAR